MPDDPPSGVPSDPSDMDIPVSEDGGFVDTTATAQDITAHKQALEELRQARDELEERVEERTTELRERADQLRRLASELTRSEQRERSRMASLLHDHVQQLLVSAKMRCEGLRRKIGEPQKEDVTAIASLLNECLESLRSLTFDLFPPILNEGLAPALEWLGGVWMKEKYDLTVAVDLDRRIDAPNEEVRRMVFLAVRELLFNVVKHSGVREARVELAGESGSFLRVTVRDGGRGFDPKALVGVPPSGTGLGLLTMRERIEMLGGTLDLRGADGGGVEAVVTAPSGPNAAGKESKRVSASP